MPSDGYVVPGQYLTPIRKMSENGVVEEYTSGKGTIIAEIYVDQERKKSLPVITATLAGKLVMKRKENDNDEDNEKNGNSDSTAKVKLEYIVSVFPKNTEVDFTKEEHLNCNIANSTRLPVEGDIALVRITRISQRQANCEILSVEGRGNTLQDSGVGANGEVAHESIPPGGGAQSLTTYGAMASHVVSLNSAPYDLGESFRGIIRTQDVRLTERDKIKMADCFKPGDIVRGEIISLGDGSNYYLTTARNDLGVILARSEGGAGGLLYAVDWQTMICPSTGVIEKRKCANPFLNKEEK